MKVCIIGSTGHTSYVLKGLMECSNVHLAGIAPGSKGERLDGLVKKAAELGYSVKEFEDYREMLDTVKPDIVAVACYFNDHAAIAIEAMNRGIHIFVEKPIAITLEDLESVKQAYSKSGVHLAAMFGIRYKRSFLTAKQLIQEGSIGSVRLMNTQKSYKLNERSEVYRNRQTYGGTIPWVGSHAIDWMHWLSGERFSSVFAAHSTLANRGHGDLEATALCHFSFENEVFGSVSIDYLRPQAAVTHADDRIRIVGSYGVLEVRDNQVYLINQDFDGSEGMPLLPEQNIFTDFLQQVRGAGTCMVSAEDSFIVTEACLRARQSADEQRIVYFGG